MCISLTMVIIVLIIIIWQANTVLHLFNEFNLRQYNNIVNINRNILDLVFSNLRDVSVHLVSEPICTCDHYHPAITISLPMSTGPLFFSSPSEWRFNFKRANYEEINNYLGNIMWDDELSHLDVNSAIDFLYSHLDYAITAFVPRYLPRRSTYPAWFLKS